MSTIVLFHSALGLRPAVHWFADQLRQDHHTVHTPDLFDGRVFDRLEDGVALRDALGVPELMRRAAAAVADLPEGVVYAGLSMGAGAAQWLAATRPGAKGAVLLHAALPVQALGVERWPDVPLQLHYAEGDSWVDGAAVQELRSQAAAVFVYPGGGHLFTDADSPEHDHASTALVVERVRDFLEHRASTSPPSS
jgi:dienelactone hydrolase